jgi:hypothetical protein
VTKELAFNTAVSVIISAFINDIHFRPSLTFASKAADVVLYKTKLDSMASLQTLISLAKLELTYTLAYNLCICKLVYMSILVHQEMTDC